MRVEFCKRPILRSAVLSWGIGLGGVVWAVATIYHSVVNHTFARLFGLDGNRVNLSCDLLATAGILLYRRVSRRYYHDLAAGVPMRRRGIRGWFLSTPQVSITDGGVTTAKAAYSWAQLQESYRQFGDTNLPLDFRALAPGDAEQVRQYILHRCDPDRYPEPPAASRWRTFGMQ